MKPVIFFLPLLRHESTSERTQFLTIESGHQHYNLITDVKTLITQSNSIVITDDISRMGETPKKVISVILTILKRDNQITVPNQLSLNNADSKSVELINLLNRIPSNIKSRKIKDALYAKKAISGVVHDSSALTPEMVKRIRDEFNGGVRSTARKLGVSPASVSRVINNKK